MIKKIQCKYYNERILSDLEAGKKIKIRVWERVLSLLAELSKHTLWVYDGCIKIDLLQ